MSVDWSENDALFRTELTAGHRWASTIVDRLQKLGIPAAQAPMEWRRDLADAARFANEQDITVTLPTRMFVIEAKSRRLDFNESPGSYPYPTAYIDTAKGWDRKDPKPGAVVLVSQVSGRMLVVPVRATRDRWSRTSTFDRLRGFEMVAYEMLSATFSDPSGR